MTTIGFPLGRLDGQFDRLFRDLVRPAPATDPRAAARAFAPAVDVREEPDALVLEADVPGLAPEAIEVSYDNGVLTLSGERKEPTGEKAATFHRVERAWGRFERRFALPAEVDGAGIEATWAAGVLTIRLPKRAELRARTIAVKAR
jgi:HSP20 family protein